MSDPNVVKVELTIDGTSYEVLAATIERKVDEVQALLGDDAEWLERS